MDEVEKILNLYGIEPQVAFVNDIRNLLLNEIENKENNDYEYLKTLCIQLFAIGMVNDTLLIWRSKERDFDAHSYIDVQLLCGAGFEATLSYLRGINSDEAREEAVYIKGCEAKFANFNRKKVLDFYKEYYGIE